MQQLEFFVLFSSLLCLLTLPIYLSFQPTSNEHLIPDFWINQIDNQLLDRSRDQYSEIYIVNHFQQAFNFWFLNHLNRWSALDKSKNQYSWSSLNKSLIFNSWINQTDDQHSDKFRDSILCLFFSYLFCCMLTVLFFFFFSRYSTIITKDSTLLWKIDY